MYLDDRELHSLADVALAVLNAHMARPSLEADPRADRLAGIMDHTLWYWHADHRDDLLTLFSSVDYDQTSLIAEAGMQICTTFIEKYALDGYIVSLTDSDLMSVRETINKQIGERGIE